MNPMTFGLLLGFAAGVFFAFLWTLIEVTLDARSKSRWDVEIDQAVELSESDLHARLEPRSERGNAAVLGGVAFLVVAIVIGLIYVGARLSTEKTITCTVTGKDRTTKVISDANGGTSSSSDARIYTEDCGTLQVADELIKGRFSSADTYAAIKPGHRYEFQVIGWRNGFLSEFPNILHGTEVGR